MIFYLLNIFMILENAPFFFFLSLIFAEASFASLASLAPALAHQDGFIALVEADDPANGAAHFTDIVPDSAHPHQAHRGEVLPDLAGIHVQRPAQLGAGGQTGR